jgi:hypothetical protein
MTDDGALVEKVARAICRADLEITDFPYMGAASESRKQGLVDEFWCEHVPHARAALSATPLERYRAALEEIAVYPGLAQEIARKALEGE